MNWEILREVVLELIAQTLENQEKEIEKALQLLSKILHEEERNEEQVLLTQVSTNLMKTVYEAISKIVEIFSELTKKDLNSVIEEIVNEVYPDGLKLSERLWKWDSELRLAVAQIIANGIKNKKTAKALAYEIESHIYFHGSLEDSLRLKYLEEIKKNLSLNIKNMEDRKKLERFLKELEKTLKALKGARYAERKNLINKLKEALEKKSNEIMKRAIENYLKKEALRKIQRITITEMANTFHKVQIKATQDDPDIVGYRWKLSKSHPKPDICDVYANVDFGLGKGVWPRTKVPKKKPHPYCLCYLLPVYSSKKKELKDTPRYDLEPLIKQHKYLKALDNLGFPLQKIINLDPETGKYLREKDFLEKFKIDKKDWEIIKKTFTDKKLKELAKKLGVGAKSIYREGDLIRYTANLHTKVVKVIKDLLGNERILTEMAVKHIREEINLPKKKTKWQTPYMEWGLKNIEKILAKPDKIVFHKPSQTFYYTKEYNNVLISVAVDKQGYIYTVSPIKISETKPEGTYIVIYES